MIRKIESKEITNLVEKLAIEANYVLTDDIRKGITDGISTEKSPLGRDILNTLIENADIAKNEQCPMCQDTGLTIVFVEIGQEVQIVGGSMEEAINEGVRRGYEKGYLRKSVVNDPIRRENTGDNTPAIIYYDIVPGNTFKLTVAPKGFGSENMSQLRMLKPSEGVEGIKEFVIKTVSDAGSNPCPPIIVGVGIGGSMDKSALLSKQALLIPLDKVNSDPLLAKLEEELLEAINNLGIGPAGFGGTTTALAVKIKSYATHIAGLPVAVNIGCHATRHAEGTL